MTLLSLRSVPMLLGVIDDREIRGPVGRGVFSAGRVADGVAGIVVVVVGELVGDVAAGAGSDILQCVTTSGYHEDKIYETLRKTVYIAVERSCIQHSAESHVEYVQAEPGTWMETRAEQIATMSVDVDACVHPTSSPSQPEA